MYSTENCLRSGSRSPSALQADDAHRQSLPSNCNPRRVSKAKLSRTKQTPRCRRLTMIPVINQTLSSFGFLTASADTYCGTSAEVHYISIEARFGDQGGGRPWNRRDFAATVIQIDFSVNLETLRVLDGTGYSRSRYC